MRILPPEDEAGERDIDAAVPHSLKRLQGGYENACPY